MDIKKLENKIKIIQNKFSAGQFDEVISDAKLLLKKFSNQQILYNILSLAYQKKGENIKSIDLLTNAIKKIPNNIFFLNNLGTSYYNIKNFEEAEYYLLRAMEMNPIGRRGYEGLMPFLYMAMGDSNKSLEWCNILYDRGSHSRYNGWRAAIYVHLGDFENARIFLKKRAHWEEKAGKMKPYKNYQ